MKKALPVLFAILGIFDSLYLTYEHFSDAIPPCKAGFIADCGKVLTSEYAVVLGIPLALIGFFYYSVLLIVSFLAWKTKLKIYKYLLFIVTLGGLVASAYFMYLQLVVIKAICLYCAFSAINSLIVFFAARIVFKEDYYLWRLVLVAFIYKYAMKPLLFLMKPEIIHNNMTRVGELIGHTFFLKKLLAWFFCKRISLLEQRIHGIHFNLPVGLSAGFDYEARLTQVLYAIGFGFQSIGTITYLPYEGNPKPMLGRLPKSRSLMVNKGFKNDGAKAVIEKLQGLKFKIPLGISIGRTNTKDITSIKEAIQDIVYSFQLFENTLNTQSYYELNISCPNLFGNISFYPPKNLEMLLKAIDSLHLRKPVFIKMPIEKSNTEFLNMLKVIVHHKVAGIIVGNLQKDRTDKSFDRQEVKQWTVGNFSGKPTQQRSDELIALTYKHYRTKLTIIGCGGIFNAKDAYRKIKLGASLVQLITGMIFQGPQLIAQINQELQILIKKDGFNHISEAVGSGNK